MDRKLGHEVYVRGRPFNIQLLSILALWFFTSATPLFGDILSNSEPSSSEIANQAGFSIEAFEKMTDGPVQWVTAGQGVLVYGAGQEAYLAPEETPDITVASLTFDHNISEALILGRLAFLSEEGVGLRILDLEDPSNPIDLGSYDLPGTTFHLAHWGGFLFIGGEDGGVRVLEVFPPGSEPSFERPRTPVERTRVFLDWRTHHGDGNLR